MVAIDVCEYVGRRSGRVASLEPCSSKAVPWARPSGIRVFWVMDGAFEEEWRQSTSLFLKKFVELLNRRVDESQSVFHRFSHLNEVQWVNIAPVQRLDTLLAIR